MKDELRDRYIGYYASVTEIDDNVARVVDALKERGTLGKHGNHLYLRSRLQRLGIMVFSARETARAR